MKINNLYPANIDIKHDYIKVNNLYISHIIIQDLPQEIEMFELKKIIPKNIENTTSMYITKMDSNEQIRKLSKVILESSSELKVMNNNMISRDLARKINDEASEFRRKLQVENEDVYGLNIYISISDVNLDNLKLNINKIISSLYANNIYAKVANFRHDTVYLDSLPIFCKDENLTKQSAINITTSQGAYLIPYIKNDIYDQNGILYGYINKEFCIYDIFSSKNMNHNMCVLGSSGSGKSYFVKTIIMRNFCMNIRQIIFDIEEEYLNISKHANTIVYNIHNFNLLFIPRIFAENNKFDFLNKKIDSVISYFNLVTNSKTVVYENEIKKELIEIYNLKGINDDLNSLYELEDKVKFSLNKQYKKYSSFPNIKELIDRLEKNEKLPKPLIKILKSGNMYKRYNEEKAKELDDKFDTISIFNMKSLGVHNFSTCMNFAEEYYGQNLLIYIDEVWKFMSENSKENICRKIAELYKTIRKKKAGIVIVSQDIHDILRYEDGTFGKSILNNSYTKLFFKMQYLDLAVLKEIGICSEEILNGIKKLLIGSACMTIGDVSFNIDIKASKAEKKILGGEAIEENFSSSR